MRTSPVVSFGLYALTIKQDSTAACPDLQTFSKMSDLKTGNYTSRPYITYEPDFWLLSGNYKFKPDNDAVVHVGLMSLSMSDDLGAFAVPPVLTITFADVHTADGLTLQFSQSSDDYANDIQVRFYDASNSLISDDLYVPTDWEFQTGKAVANFKKIIITFNATNKPYRYLRLKGINYGEYINFTNADIKSCVVTEQFNPLSLELPIDTCELVLHSNDARFSIIAPSGDYAALQERQPLDVYENVGSDQVYIGQFYLDTWENPSDNEIKFSAIDIIGVLDTIPYAGGVINTTAGLLLESMLSAISIPYDLDPALYSAAVVGTLDKTTYRDALQQIAFSIGAYVTAARSGVLQIYSTVLASDLAVFDYDILRSQKGISQSLSLKTLVTGVEITYGVSDTVYGVYNTTIDPNVRENIIEIKTAVFVTAGNVAAIAQRVYDYYQMRYLQKTKLYAPSAAVGNSVLVDTLYERQIGGIVEKMVLDLSGGFTAKTEITGVVIDV